MKQERGMIWAGRLVMILAMIQAVLLTGCAANTDALVVDTPRPMENVQKPVPTEGEAEAEIGQSSPEESESAAESTEASQEATDENRIPEPELGFDYGDPNLKATAPGAFVRAAGKPQLVELFAFW